MTKEENVIQSLSPIERAVLPHLEKKNIEEISKEAKLDITSVKRAIQFLSNKDVLKISFKQSKQIVLGENGKNYLKHGLPEKKLLEVVSKNNNLSLKEAREKSNLDGNEFAVALGALKKKALISIFQDKIKLCAEKHEIEKESNEEKFLKKLPLNAEKLSENDKEVLENLKLRKEIIKIEEANELHFEITNSGKNLIKEFEKIKHVNYIEELTPSILKGGAWKGKQFRHYDIKSKVPEIYGGKRHFVNQAIDYAKNIWVEMGFKEMKGNIINTSFWDFDSLFVPQDHPVREMQDTFFVEGKGTLPDKKLVEKIKNTHEHGTSGSKGWQYAWNEEDAKKLVLRTHTTVLSAQTLAKLKKSDWPAKFFAIGRCYRNETLDWKHIFEFNQTEGIVVDPNANFRHLIGYLKEFFKKMGFEKARFRPSFFPYTEPSIEIDVFHPIMKQWMEIGGAGIFRPEVTEPLLGEPVPVLAWGPGFDRLLLQYYKINDIRELYGNNLSQLRKIKMWMR